MRLAFIPFVISVASITLAAAPTARVGPAERIPTAFELLDTPSEHVEDYALPVTVDATGYSSLGLTVTTSPPGADVLYHLNWSWGEDDSYGQVLDYRAVSQEGNPLCYAGHLFNPDMKLLCPVTNGRVQVAVSAVQGVVFTSVRLYLIP